MCRAFGLCLLLWSAIATGAAADPSFWKHEWPDTDFSNTSVSSWVEVISGGPPKDGIPALSDPQFVEVAQKEGIAPTEPVITVELDGEHPRAYPIRYLMWHEIVNDSIGGVPVAVTFCPLCNSALTFDRRVDGRVLTFGVSGKLRNSDMIMYDRETQSWWQQAVGMGIVGDMTGIRLKPVASWMESFGTFEQRNPDGLVMVEPEWQRPYGRNPYRNYDTSKRPFLYSGEMPPHGIPPLMRVIRVGDRAWPMDRLAREADVTEDGVRILWQSGVNSALDADRIADGRDVGAVRVMDAAGRDLPHDVMFAFAFHAFWPEGRWMLGAN